MVDNKTQFITDGSGNKIAAILPIKKYYQIIEELEDKEDIRLFDEAQNDNDEGIPIDEAFKIIEEEPKKNGL